MLRLVLTVAVAALVLSRPGPAVADENKDARAIIAKAIEVQGGQANLEKYKASTVKTKGKFHGFGLNADTTGIIQSVMPDKLRIESKSKANGMDFNFLLVVNGDKAWMSFNGDSQELDKEMMAEMREQLHVGQVTDLRGLTDKAVKLALMGESKVGDKTAVGIRVSCAGYRDISLYFDKASTLLVRSETRAKDPMSGGEITVERLYSDYKKVNGLMVPHKVEEKHDREPYTETEVLDVTLAEKLPESTFAKP
jgi:hypothetical protein